MVTSIPVGSSGGQLTFRSVGGGQRAPRHRLREAAPRAPPKTAVRSHLGTATAGRSRSPGCRARCPPRPPPRCPSRMLSPRLDPWLIPETISSGRSPRSPRSAKRTQSTGCRRSRTRSNRRRRSPPRPTAASGGDAARGGAAVGVRRDHVRLGFLLQRRRAAACRPSAWIPSSFVIRTRTRPILGTGRPCNQPPP